MPADKTRFGQLMVMISAALQPGKLEPAQIETYYIALGHVPIEKLDGAFKMALARCEFMPKPEKLLEFIFSIDGQIGAEEAHCMVTSAIRKYGPYCNMKFPCPINYIINSMGGWVEVCGSRTDLWHGTKKRDFIKLFKAAEAMSRSGLMLPAPDYLPGLMAGYLKRRGKHVIIAITGHNTHCALPGGGDNDNKE